MALNMRRHLVLLVFVTVVALALPSRMAFAGGEKMPPVVSPAWVAAHLSDPDLIVLSVAQSVRIYREGHIPGARFLWYMGVAAATPELSTELVPPEQIDTLLEGLGVSSGSRIVLCGAKGNVSATARTYVTLEYLGLGDQTSILDGGLEAWKAAGNPVSKETPVYARGSLTPHLKRDAIVGVDFVTSHMRTGGVTLLDARAPAFYNGIGGGFPRPGRIPGARNLFYTTLYDSTDRFLPVDSLQARFTAAGIKPGDEIIAYCHTGQTASSVYVAARLLGHAVHLYDGSFEDWSGRDELPVDLEAKKDPVKK